MKKINFIITACALMASSAVMAQGQRISGNVSDAMGAVIGGNVVERDANNRIVSATVTDFNGNFSMTVKNPKNKLVVSYVGAQSYTTTIGARTSFKIKLQNATTVKEVTVKGKSRYRSGGLSIPKNEVSVATQTMNMSDVEGLAFTSADEALQGKIAGLDIVANSGNLGSGTSMRLRGVNSINGSAEPLIVVDGNIFDVPGGTDNVDFSTATEEQYSSLLSVNPSDIESIDILKDAAATAVWGSRGANGVISIKTKRGSRGKIRVDYAYSIQATWQPKGYNLLSGDDYSMLMKEELYNPNQGATATTNVNELNYKKSWPEYNNWNDNTDWADEVKKTGFNQSHYLTLNGGGEKASFRVSVGYDHQTGTILKQTLDRFSTRLILDYWVSDRIKFSTTFPLTYTNNQKNYDGNILGRALQMAPNMSVYREDANGNDTNEYYIMLPSGNSNNSGYSSEQLKDVRSVGNPVAIANLAWNNEKTYRINPEFKIDYNLLGTDDSHTRLDYMGLVYMDIYSNSSPTYWPGSLSTEPWTDGGYNKSTLYDKNSLAFTTRHRLTFTPHFKNEDWYLTMMGQWEMTSGSDYSQKVSAYKLPLGITSPTVQSDWSEMSTGNGEWRSMSALYSAHASWKSRYMLDFTLRADGTTKFGSKNKWGYFPALSGRWNISDEPWMKWSRKFISMLSFRPSWGISGNQPNNEYLQYSKYASSGTYGPGNNNLPVTVVDGMQLTDLKWEKTNSYNMGGNLGLFDDLVEVDFNYYYKKTSNLLNTSVSIASQTGFSSLAWKNIGTMENKGWELNIDSRNLIKRGKFTFGANFNISQNFNKILDMDQSVLDGINEEWTSDSRGKYFKRVQPGNALGSIFGLRYQGVYQYSYDWLMNYQKQNNMTDQQLINYINNEFLPQGKTAPIALDANGRVIVAADGSPLRMAYAYNNGKATYEFDGGDAIYEDVNHDGQINSLDMVYLGNSNPKFSGGFGFTFKYGQWSLRTNFVFRTGFKIVNAARMGLEKMYNTTNQSSAVNWRWRKNGDVTEMPRALYDTGYNWLGSDRYVEDASFLRFSYVSLSYDCPKTFLKKIGLNRLRFDVNAQNILVWTKYSGTDPEHTSGGWNFATDSSQTPRSKSVTLRVNVGI